MAAMFVNLKQKLQSLSPIGSPVGSPNASPKPRRRFAFKTPARMKQRREEFREVQSDPECDYESTRKQKRKSTSSSTKQKQYYEDLYDVPPKPRRKNGSSYFSPKAQSQTLGRMEGKKQVQRLAQYERYFQDLLAETSADHPDVDDLGRVRARVSQLVSASAAEHCELDRVQDLFPSDNLGLYHRDPTYPRMKGLIRKRSAPATRLQRALSAKTLRPSTADPTIPSNAEDARDSAMPSDTSESPSKRQFIMESAVQFTLALQSQERHLFLFSDMLLVAKARSGGNFKLKDKLRLSEMWLAGCLDEVTEATKDPSTSFVLGWPTTNVVATFSCSAARDLWYNKLSQMMAEERQTEPKTTTIRVVYYDQLNNIDFCKTMSVDCSMTARDCVRTALTNLEMTEASAADYQLWVRTGREDAPYPLIGHELPFAIKMNLMREYLTEDGGCGSHTANEMDHCNNIYNGDATLKCQFILRHVRKGVMTPSPGGNSASKKKKPLRKSPIRIHKVFRRTNSKCDSVDSAISACNSGLLFGQPLSTLCQHEPIPKPVLDMLMQIFMIGPFTVGIFRKSANARLVKEFREKLDTELDVNVESVNICVIACLVKDFFRSLPDAVLGSDLYDEWRELTEVEDDVEKVHRVRELCSRLPAANVTLLCHFLCVLHHIALRSRHNLMSPANLAVCVGPSLLSPGNPAQVMTAEHSKLLPAVVEFLIDKCAAIFGPECLTLFGPAPDKEIRTDSGAEESDSVNSSGGVRRDDSSIDSLERELLGENEPLPRKDKMSVTNLSRDSGLTMSDTQLYTPDDEESASNSSGHSGSRTAAEKPGSAYSSGRGSDRHIVSYSAPNNPNAIYAAIYRRRHQLGPTYSSPSPSQTTPAGCGQLADYGSSVHARSYSPSADVTFEDVLYAHPPTRRINSNFQRQDWTRQRHLLRRSANSGSSGRSGKSSVTPPPGKGSTQRQLRRSTSEESLLNGCYSTTVGRQHGGSVTRIGVPASLSGHSGAAEEPAGHGCRYSRLYQAEMEEQSLPTMLRSKSAHHIVEKRAVAATKAARLCSAVNSEWLRSRSTPHVDEVDRSYDSSTLSDDDSTPHVSRSNSRTKDCALANDLWERAYGSTLDNRSEDSGSYTSRTGSFSTIRSTGTVRSVDTTPGATCTPPSYEATLSRRGWLQHKPSLSEGRARQMYSDSLRVNEQQKSDASTADAMHHASPVRAIEAAVDGKYPPPLPPKTEAPPLPPKQKTPLKRVGPQMSSGGNSGRLKQLPPVHVETTAWKSRGNGSVYIRTGEAVLHEAPALPPKERTVIQIESDYVAPSVVRPQRPKRRVSKREVQTQTDEEPTLDGDEVALSVRAPHVTLVEIECRGGPLSGQASPVGPSERRGRNRRRDRQQRARSQPASCDDDQLEEPETTLEWSQQQDDRTPISWSVSRLRAMFSPQSADDVPSSDSGRHPPLRRTSVGLLLNGDSVYAQPASQLSTAAPSRPAGRRRADSGGSGYGEESYV